MSKVSDKTKGDTPRQGGPTEAPSGPGSPDRVQQMLDEALADSFPASDPVSIVTSQHEEAWCPQAPPQEKKPRQ
jgi:hypothetical protein